VVQAAMADCMEQRAEVEEVRETALTLEQAEAARVDFV
jgi:hypothetical protein